MSDSLQQYASILANNLNSKVHIGDGVTHQLDVSVVVPSPILLDYNFQRMLTLPVKDPQEAADNLRMLRLMLVWLALSKEVSAYLHAGNTTNGFWPGTVEERQKDAKNDIATRLFLAVTELAEGFEGFRDNTDNWYGSQDKHLPELPNVAVEIADTIIRLLDVAEGYQLPVLDAVVMKVIYNRTRPPKHGRSF